MFIVVLIPTLLNIAQFLSEPNSNLNRSSVPLRNDHIQPLEVPSSFMPDIYHIILDGYPGQSFLADEYHFDNVEFANQLQELGFFFANNSAANYNRSRFSLNSMLHLNYLSNLLDDPNNAEQRLLSTFADNPVAKLFKTIGYEYHYPMGGYFDGSTIADINYDLIYNQFTRISDSNELRNETQNILKNLIIDTSILRIGSGFLHQNLVNNYSYRPPERILMIFNVLNEIASNPKPTFTIAHIGRPHEPITFDRNGTVINPVSITNEQAFTDQLEFINDKTIATIMTILENSETPPIILIHGDHGTHYGENKDLEYPFETLLTIYLPDQDYSQFSDDMTLINVYRILFNQYWATSYDLLDELHFIRRGYDTVFTQCTRTECQEVILENHAIWTK